MGVFSFINKVAVNASIERIAKVAATTQAFESGVTTAFRTEEVIAGFFNKYGTTQRRYDFHPQPGFFIGYVRVPDQSDEFLCLVILQPREGSVVSSFWPELDHGQDLFGLIGKQMFAEKIAAMFIGQKFE